jgi:hypothetical protein
MRAMEVGLKGSSSPLISTYYFFVKIWDVDADMKKLYKTYNHNQPHKILRATRLGMEEWEHRNHHDHLGARRCSMLHAVGAAAGHQPSERHDFGASEYGQLHNFMAMKAMTWCLGHELCLFCSRTLSHYRWLVPYFWRYFWNFWK